MAGWRAGWAWAGLARATSGGHRHQCSPVMSPTNMAQPRLASPHAQCMGNSAHDSQPVSGHLWVITQTHRSHRGVMAPPHQKHTRDGMEPQLKRTRTHARTYVRTYVRTWIFALFLFKEGDEKLNCTLKYRASRAYAGANAWKIEELKGTHHPTNPNHPTQTSLHRIQSHRTPPCVRTYVCALAFSQAM